MRAGICVYSGHAIPKGKGLLRVGLDGKQIFLRNKKVLSFVTRKVSPRSVRWTQACRVQHKKGLSRKTGGIRSVVRPVKIIRGFDNVPSALVRKEREVKEEGSDMRKEKIQRVSGDRKVYRSSNLGRGKK